MTPSDPPPPAQADARKPDGPGTDKTGGTASFADRPISRGPTAAPSPGRDVRRLDRQFAWMRRKYPRAGALVQRVTRPGWALLRVPVAILFVLGGILAILPVFGLWMIPVGLALLAVDVPQLRRPVAAAVIRLRRRIEMRRNRRRGN